MNNIASKSMFSTIFFFFLLSWPLNKTKNKKIRKNKNKRRGRETTGEERVRILSAYDGEFFYVVE